MNNLVGNPGSEAILAAMQKQHDDWRTRTPDAEERSGETMKKVRKAKAAERRETPAS